MITREQIKLLAKEIHPHIQNEVGNSKSANNVRKAFVEGVIEQALKISAGLPDHIMEKFTNVHIELRADFTKVK